MRKVTVIVDSDDYEYICRIAKANDLTVSQAATVLLSNAVIDSMLGDYDGTDSADT